MFLSHLTLTGKRAGKQSYLTDRKESWETKLLDCTGKAEIMMTMMMKKNKKKMKKEKKNKEVH